MPGHITSLQSTTKTSLHSFKPVTVEVASWAKIEQIGLAISVEPFSIPT
jgi:hypothetical protein